jgi:hypothetical protein
VCGEGGRERERAVTEAIMNDLITRFVTGYLLRGNNDLIISTFREY